MRYLGLERGRMCRIVAGFLFCALVGIILLILYYPGSSIERYSSKDKLLTKDILPPEIITIKSWNDDFDDVGTTPPESKISIVAKFLEDIGAGLLCLIAVICVAVGIGCLICACCC